MNNNNNKGFTLIELIVVIAIIAVLAVVLAPQYIQYVERSRESNDLQIATSILDAAKLAIADPNNDIPSGYIIEVLWCSGDIAVAAGYDGVVLARDVNRVSAISTTAVANNVVSLDDGVILDRFSLAMFTNLGIEAVHDSTYPLSVPGEYLSYAGKPESELASEAVFAFHINTTTGETALARWTADGDVNEWLDLGMQITPAP